MVKQEMKIIEQIHLQKYIYLLNLFIEKHIEITLFENIFLKIRSEDNFWLEGYFTKDVSKVLDAFFLDVDEYCPVNLYDPSDKFNINEVELRKRAMNTLNRLKTPNLHSL